MRGGGIPKCAGGKAFVVFAWPKKVRFIAHALRRKSCKRAINCSGIAFRQCALEQIGRNLFCNARFLSEDSRKLSPQRLKVGAFNELVFAK